MKKLVLYTAVFSSLLAGYGCSTKKGSDNAAMKANEERIDNQSVALSDEARKDAKNVAEALVELSSMSMTETELSREALQRATNPQVKALAQRIVTEHQQMQQELQELATQLNVTLPTALSRKGQDRVEDLKDQEAGTAFDRQYLKEIEELNDSIVDYADDLSDDAPNDTVRKAARRMIDANKELREQARQLRNVLS